MIVNYKSDDFFICSFHHEDKHHLNSLDPHPHIGWCVNSVKFSKIALQDLSPNKLLIATIHMIRSGLSPYPPSYLPQNQYSMKKRTGNN